MKSTNPFSIHAIKISYDCHIYYILYCSKATVFICPVIMILSMLLVYPRQEQQIFLRCETKGNVT